MKDTVVFIIQVTQQLMQISARPPLPLLSSPPFPYSVCFTLSLVFLLFGASLLLIFFCQR
jgi:hypothetical protein